jgi:hypothetical protein
MSGSSEVELVPEGELSIGRGRSLPEVMTEPSLTWTIVDGWLPTGFMGEQVAEARLGRGGVGTRGQAQRQARRKSARGHDRAFPDVRHSRRSGFLWDS